MNRCPRNAGGGTHRVRLMINAVVLLVSCAPGVVAPAAADAELRSGEPLRVGTNSGVGVFAVPSISCSPLGAVDVFGGRRPDLFVVSDRWHPALYLYRWTGDDPNGVPIFSQPIEIEAPFDETKINPGYVLADDVGNIFGFWLRSGRLTAARFDTVERCFQIMWQAEITGLPRNPEQVVVRLLPDGRLEGFLTVPDGTQYRPGDHRAPDYNPFDGAGIWRGSLPRDGIFRFVCSWTEAPRTVEAEAVLRPEDGGLLGINSLEWIRLPGVAKDKLLYGTTLGGMFFVPGALDRRSESQWPAKLPVIDPHGIAMRHPAVWTYMAAYPAASDGARTDLVAGGEGGMYYYRYAGRLGSRGQPVFELLGEVLQESAELFSGSLIVPNVVDWNGDGALDIVAGNAAGHLLFFENAGTTDRPRFLPATRIEAGGQPVLVRGGYRRGIQGPGEAHWGYTSPTVVDWNRSGLLDIVMNDVRNIHTVYLNRGTRARPELALPRELIVESLELHGTWRTRPAAGRLGERTAYVTLDVDDELHLYWQLDDFHLEDGGKLRLADGSPIRANFLPAGGTGRAKFEFVDWDQDGKVDLLVGTPRHGSFPEPKRGVPWSMNGAGAAVLLLRNVGCNRQPVYEYPAVMHFRGAPVHFGQHACSPTATRLGGGDGLNLIVGTELGRLIFFRGADITWVTVR